MKLIFSFFAYLLVTVAIFSCTETGLSEAVGGELPTNYIIVKDSSFTPPAITRVSGSSFTFVNNTAIAHTIMTDDSITIKPVTIAPGTSYFHKKDSSGSFSYRCTTHPVARGTITLTP